MVRYFRNVLLSSVLCTAGLAAPAAADANVVVSIKPLHSLIAAVMQGLGEPHLIVRDAGSPHTYSLRPSDAKALERAEIVFWIGDEMETFLESTIETLARKATIVEVAHMDGLVLLANREGGAWEAHDDEEAGHDEHADADGDEEHEDAAGQDTEKELAHGETNMHLWLDSHNAMAIVAQAAKALSAADPSNAAAYAANAEAAQAQLTALDEELQATLSPVRNRPFVVFHDAYHYLENRYGLTAVGSVTVSPDQQPSAERLHELREKIGTSGAACAFAEPQFRPAIVDTIVEGLDTRVGVLDPLGADIENGPDLYFTLMRNNAEALSSCLSGSS
jgi:zinc transport system substrate-binding protein